MEEEVWKDIEFYENNYQISNLGNLQSKDRIVPVNSFMKHKFQKGIPLKLKIDRYGYYTIGLYNNSKCKRCTVHRLVAKSFIPNPNNLPQVNHLDGNKLNNYYKNLEWCTQSGNMLHAYRIGLETGMKGEDHPMCKFSQEDINEIRKIYTDTNCTQMSLAKKYNASHQHISDIINFKTRNYP